MYIRIRKVAVDAMMRNFAAIEALAGTTTPLAKEWRQLTDDIRNDPEDELDAFTVRILAICERIEKGET